MYVLWIGVVLNDALATVYLSFHMHSLHTITGDAAQSVLHVSLYICVTLSLTKKSNNIIKTKPNIFILLSLPIPMVLSN